MRLGISRLFAVVPGLAGLVGIACSSASGGPGGTMASGGTSGRDAGVDDAALPVALDGALDGALDALAGDAGTVTDTGASDAVSVPADGGPPPGFWDASNIPPAKNVMMFKFLNRTYGRFQDGEVYWSFKSGSINETHSIADQNLYDMPANASGRMYFYLCATGDTTCAGDPTKSLYFDFIEHTIGATQYNGNTTRVDAFGLKLAIRLHCSDGYDVAVGENYATFAEDRAVTFQSFINEVPPAFQALAQPPNAPYRIVQPGAGSFGTGGANANYYDSFVNTIWANNGITMAKPGPNGSGLASFPDLSAAIYRHVGDAAGSFDPSGKLMNMQLWTNAATFYTAAPADYYARFWHERALNGRAYGFPYDDVGGYSSYISHSHPQYMLVAIGW